MSKGAGRLISPWEKFHGPNLGYIMEAYEAYLENQEVDPELVAMFQQWGPPAAGATDTTTENTSFTQTVAQGLSPDQLLKAVQAVKLADNIRSYGHLAADINPLENSEKDTKRMELSEYGLTEDDLKGLPSTFIIQNPPAHIKNALDAINHLKQVYTKSLAFELHHVHDQEEKNWLRNMVESEDYFPALTPEKQKEMLKRLAEVEGFENFIHRTFVGQKRFSIEGVDSLVPLLDEIISESVQSGAKTINIGMAHRGRLNVLAHVLGKPYEMIFAEFQHAPNKELVPSEGSIGINYGWTGDVKYHLGLDRQIKDENTIRARITLANNPSHLEFVDPVVVGYTRAAQEKRTEPGFPDQDPTSSFAILIHGDAAFPGQGIVAETLNLSQLRGYHTGGTIHIIANNMIGFTTESHDSRSTKYASDLAKGYEVPIVHVNADDPEAVLAAAHFATLYRKTFQKDFLIDLIGYRRYGHNEMDEPVATNPLMYNIIHKRPTVKNLYFDSLKQKGLVRDGELKQIDDSITQKLKEAYDKVPKHSEELDTEMRPPEIVEQGFPKIKTAVENGTLSQLNEDLLKWPEGFKVFNKLDKILRRRSKAYKEGKIDWAHAETLAFASIVSEGTPIRLTGQDSERGTFAHRHIVLHDSDNGKVFSPLHHLPTAKASFAVHNSPLSEMAVLGFEYGYNVFSPETLVLWEAQFGDFANSAQVMFDQFIAAGRAKWGQKSGLVMLLPHGYEGQGPEHSSARLERFLTLAAENNWTVANLSTAAQYFHILRRQALMLQKEEIRPLVIMTPKSLLRHPLATSSSQELTEGEFQPIVNQPGTGVKPDSVERILLGSGKVMIDVHDEMAKSEDNFDWLQVTRVEEIYPFPMKELSDLVSKFSNLKEIVWIQEEPKNMGAWNFAEPRLKELAPKGVEVKYVGRRRRSSTAEGDPVVHKKEQTRIVHEAISR
ncbi:2-oxoglutarate dehydrogenase E1 component [Bacillus carboniphilus]|uniref:2-oxoglutarate dehydrogenase E1 component n=1 Tax=Bacillus carboniphilus TaxID=86663 RepID=A0ABP3FXK2_9BACI